MMGNFGATEIILILLVVVLLFGARKIPELMKGIGQGVKEFKKASDVKDESDTREKEDKEDKKEKKKIEPFDPVRAVRLEILKAAGKVVYEEEIDSYFEPKKSSLSEESEKIISQLVKIEKRKFEVMRKARK